MALFIAEVTVGFEPLWLGPEERAYVARLFGGDKTEVRPPG